MFKLKNESFCSRGNDCLDVFAEKNFKNLFYDFANFPKQEITFTEKKKQYWSEATCHIWQDNFIAKYKYYRKVRDHCHYKEKIQRSCTSNMHFKDINLRFKDIT